FLSWDSGLPLLDAAGNSFIGNPTLTHTVTGSPTGNNFFQIDGPDIGGPGVNSVSTNQFAICGEISAAPVPPPVPGFTATPTTGAPPLSVAFTDASTGAITARTWNFGDGATSNAVSPTHVYAATGSYSVTLTVTGQGGTVPVTQPNLISVTVPPPAAN